MEEDPGCSPDGVIDEEPAVEITPLLSFFVKMIVPVTAAKLEDVLIGLGVTKIEYFACILSLALGLEKVYVSEGDTE